MHPFMRIPVFSILLYFHGSLSNLIAIKILVQFMTVKDAVFVLYSLYSVEIKSTVPTEYN